MEGRYDGFIDWLKEDAVDWGDPDSEFYEYPLRPDAPKSAIIAYKQFLEEEMQAKQEGRIID